MKTKVEPTVEKWEELEEQLAYFSARWGVKLKQVEIEGETYEETAINWIRHLAKSIKASSVQEAKAEALTAQKEKMVKMCEEERWTGPEPFKKSRVMKGMRIAINNDYADGYNQALDDLKRKIKEEL